MGAQEMLTAILIPLGCFAMVFGIVYMHKREGLAMIEKGLNPREYRPAPYKNLKWGLLLVGAGIGLFFAYIIDHTILKTDFDVEPLYMSLIGIGGGIGLIFSYKIEKKELLDK